MQNPVQLLNTKFENFTTYQLITFPQIIKVNVSTLKHPLDLVIEMNEEKNKRPIGLAILATLWLISGILHIYLAYEIIRVDLQALEYLSEPVVPVSEWFNFVVPAELALSIIALCLGALQILTVPGFLAGKKYSYKFAFAIPVAFVIVNLVFLGLYASAPAEVNLGNSMLFPALSAVVAMFWIQIHLKYLGKPNWKAYLGVTQLQPKVQDEPSLHCNHCGAENINNAETCEKCGAPVE